MNIYFSYCHAISMIFLKTEQLKEGLEWSLKIPHDVKLDDKLQKDRRLCQDLLDRIAVQCQHIIEQDVHPIERPEVRDIYFFIVEKFLTKTFFQFR